MPNQRKKDKTLISGWVKKEFKLRLQEIARELDVPVSELMAEFLREQMEMWEREKKKPKSGE